MQEIGGPQPESEPKRFAEDGGVAGDLVEDRDMAWNIDPALWVPLVGSLVGTTIGGALTILGGVLNQRMTARQEREKREHERDVERERRRRAFRLRTYLKFQDVLKDLALSVNKVMDERHLVHHNQYLLEARQALAVAFPLHTRIDGSERALAEILFSAAHATLQAAEQDAHEVAFEEFTKYRRIDMDLNHAIGAAIRGLL